MSHVPSHESASSARGDRATRQYRQPWPSDWWLRRASYTLFMIREITAVFVGGYAIFLLVLLFLPDGAFRAAVQGPVSVILHGIVLAMVLYHTVTWLNLTPKVLVVWRGEERVNPMLITATHYAGWIVLSLVIVGLAVFFAGGGA